MDGDETGSGKWWRRGARTRLHTYYYPTTNVPSLILFGIIGVLGLIAVGHAVRNYLHNHAWPRDEKVLGEVGLFLIVLAVWQIVAQLRRPPPG